MKKFIVLLLLMFCFSSSCYAAVDFMEKTMDSWVGYSTDAVISSWGYPSEEKVVANRKLLIWDRSSYNTNTSYLINFCQRTLEVNKKNIVQSWEYKGNDCPVSYLLNYQWVNPQNDPWKKKKLENKKKRELRKQQRELQKQEKQKLK